MPDLETRMPELLRRAATGIARDPDLERTVLRRARRRRIVNASATVLTALALVAGLALGARELALSGATTPADGGPSPGPGAAVGGELEAIWPETTSGALAEAQARADAGELGWRLDPAETAAAFAVQVLGWDPADVRTEPSQWISSGARARVVVAISNARLGPAQGSAGASAPETSLTLEQLGETGDRGVWLVTSADTPYIEVTMFNEPAGRVRPIGSLHGVPEDWRLGIWPMIDGHLVVEGIITAGTGGRVEVRDGSFSASLPVPRELVPEGTTTIGILLGLWDPEGTIVAAEAFPYDVTALGWETTGPTEGLPEPVLRTRDAILAAIRVRDFDALETLIDPDRFSYNFDDGSNPVPEWRKDPAVLDTLARILEMPFVTRQGTPELGTIYVWPSLTEADLEHLTDGDRAMLERLGITPRDVRAMLDAFGAYTGPRTGIAQDGTWLFYTIGGD